MQREEDGNVAVEYTDMKSEMDLKSELARVIPISMTKWKSGQKGRVFSLLNKGDELIWSSVCLHMCIRGA